MVELHRRDLRAAQVSCARHLALIPNPPRPCRMRNAPWVSCGSTTRVGHRSKSHWRARFFRGRTFICRHQQPLREAPLRSNRRRRQTQLSTRFFRSCLSRLPDAIAEQNFAANPEDSSQRQYSAHVHRAGRRRSGACRKCRRLLHAVEENQ